MAVSNPFNLRPTGDNWLGMTGTSNNFLEFQNPQFGLRAGFLNMANQKRLHGIDTIDAYINKYAPIKNAKGEIENTPEQQANYKKMLENVLGVTRGDTIDLEDPDTMLKIAKAQIKMEQGSVDYPDTLLQLGLASALQGKPPIEQMKTGTSDMVTAGIFDTPNMQRPLTDAEKAIQAEVQANRDAMLARGQNRIANQAALADLVDSDMVTIPDMSNLVPNPVLAQVQQKAQQFAQNKPNAGQNIASDNSISNINPNTVVNAGSRDIDNRAYNESLADQEILRQETRNNIMGNLDALRPQQVNTAVSSPAVVSPALNKAQQATAQTRKQTALSIPDPRIGRDEMLMRVGGAMMGASPQGGLAAYNAAINQFGNIQDYNRAQGLAMYQAQMEAQPKSGKTDKQKEADTKQLNQVDSALFDFNRALVKLDEENVTGLIAGTLGKAWDNIRGNPAAATRLLLNKLKVDDALLRIAQTKGAISNKEMDLFLSPAPSDLSDEEVWKTWIKDRIQALTVIRNRLSSGQTVGQGEMATNSQIDQFSTGVGSSFVAPNVGQSTTIDNVEVKRVN